MHKLKSIEQYSTEVGYEEVWLGELLDVDCKTMIYHVQENKNTGIFLAVPRGTWACGISLPDQGPGIEIAPLA